MVLVAAAPAATPAQTPIETARGLLKQYQEDPTRIDRARDLLEAARTLADGDLFASVPAYDATALRTYLCGGFRAVGAEARFRTPTWFS